MGNDGFFRILTFSGYVSQNSRAATLGDINIFLNALGEKQGSNLILKAISIVAMDFEVEYFECDNIQHTYFHFFKRGVDFVFSKNNDGEFLESIFFLCK